MNGHTDEWSVVAHHACHAVTQIIYGSVYIAVRSRRYRTIFCVCVCLVHVAAANANAHRNNVHTFRKSRSQTTSGFGSPTTSHWMITVSPSYASLERGFFTNSGSLEYLECEPYRLNPTNTHTSHNAYGIVVVRISGTVDRASAPVPSSGDSTITRQLHSTRPTAFCATQLYKPASHLVAPAMISSTKPS